MGASDWMKQKKRFLTSPPMTVREGLFHLAMSLDVEKVAT